MKKVPTIKAYYIADGTLSKFGQSINIKTGVFKNTEKHTHIVQAIEIKKQVTGSAFKLFDIRTTPVSTQDPLKPLPNTKQLLQNIPQAPKTSMAVNQQVYTNVSEQEVQKFINILENDPRNANPVPNQSVSNIRQEHNSGNFESAVFEEKNYMNVRHVDEFVTEFPPAELALKQLISTQFLKSTCNVLEMQCNHLIENREDTKIVKESVDDLENTLFREKANSMPYTLHQHGEIEKSHYFMHILKKYLN